MDELSKTGVKKLLYKEAPSAEFKEISFGIATYTAIANNNLNIIFKIPVNDMGEATFYPKMEAKHLIRWIDNWLRV